jgi:hypothetical protein
MSDFKPKGHLAMIAANAMWGLMSPAAKVVLTAGTVTPLLLTDMRIAGAAILFWFTSLFTPYEKVPPGDLLRLAGAACLGILFNQGCFIFGVGLSSPGEASIITTTMPMWVMVLAALILEEPITWKKAGGILLGASGAIMLVSGNLGTQATGNNPLLGDILVLTAQLSYALYLTLYRNFIRRYSLITLMKWMFLFATLILSIPSIPTVLAAPWASIDTATWAGISFIVVGGTFVAYICVMIGQKNLRPTIVGMYNYLQPIVATAIGIYMGFDHFTVLKTIAVLLIFTGVYLVTISKARQ